MENKKDEGVQSEGPPPREPKKNPLRSRDTKLRTTPLSEWFRKLPQQKKATALIVFILLMLGALAFAWYKGWLGKKSTPKLPKPRVEKRVLNQRSPVRKEALRRFAPRKNRSKSFNYPTYPLILLPRNREAYKAGKGIVEVQTNDLDGSYKIYRSGKKIFVGEGRSIVKKKHVLNASRTGIIYQITFGEVEGFTTPKNISFMLKPGDHFRYTGFYVPPGVASDIYGVSVNVSTNHPKGSYIIYDMEKKNKGSGKGINKTTLSLGGRKGSGIAYEIVFGSVHGYKTPKTIRFRLTSFASRGFRGVYCRHGQACAPERGHYQSRPCGLCGKQRRYYLVSEKTWGPWSNCSSEGVCSPGLVRKCSGERKQVCTKQCIWKACYRKKEPPNLADSGYISVEVSPTRASYKVINSKSGKAFSYQARIGNLKIHKVPYGVYKIVFADIPRYTRTPKSVSVTIRQKHPLARVRGFYNTEQNQTNVTIQLFPRFGRFKIFEIQNGEQKLLSSSVYRGSYNSFSLQRFGATYLIKFEDIGPSYITPQDIPIIANGKTLFRKVSYTVRPSVRGKVSILQNCQKSYFRIFDEKNRFYQSVGLKNLDLPFGSYRVEFEAKQGFTRPKNMMFRLSPSNPYHEIDGRLRFRYPSHAEKNARIRVVTNYGEGSYEILSQITGRSMGKGGGTSWKQFSLPVHSEKGTDYRIVFKSIPYLKTPKARTFTLCPGDQINLYSTDFSGIYRRKE